MALIIQAIHNTLVENTRTENNTVKENA
jgi:hypothetical protein